MINRRMSSIDFPGTPAKLYISQHLTEDNKAAKNSPVAPGRTGEYTRESMFFPNLLKRGKEMSYIATSRSKLPLCMAERTL